MWVKDGFNIDYLSYYDVKDHISDHLKYIAKSFKSLKDALILLNDDRTINCMRQYFRKVK